LSLVRVGDSTGDFLFFAVIRDGDTVESVLPNKGRIRNRVKGGDGAESRDIVIGEEVAQDARVGELFDDVGHRFRQGGHVSGTGDDEGVLESVLERRELERVCAHMVSFKMRLTETDAERAYVEQ
jgi:hypothetical protein